MRATRLIYVENDPALRRILARLLDKHPDIELLLHTDTPGAALHRGLVESADVALLDLALGSDEMNGIDLGLAMRRLNDNIGIVIHSQYRLDTVTRSVPQEVLFGWSALPKSGEMPIEEIVDVVRGTARGRSFGIEGNSETESPQQALLNAASHGRAEQCRIDLEVTDRLRIRVGDDGGGLPTEPTPGLGSTLLDTWCRTLNGTWRWEESPLGGVCLRAELPLREVTESGSTMSA